MDVLHSLVRLVEMFVGWVFSPSWLPPKDFQLLRLLVVPGYGYGAVLLFLGALELFMPHHERPWNRATLLSATYLLLAGKMTFYSVILTPILRNAWVGMHLPSLHLDRTLPLPLYMLAG